jgi:hypothetical protein
MSNEKLKQIRQAKHLEYGSFDANMNFIGRAWSSLLGLKTDIPGHTVANMYVVAKLIRTQGGFKQDTYDDAANYLYQAELMQKVDLERHQMEIKLPDANTRMHDALRSEHKTNYPKDEPELEPDEEELALARRREAIKRVEANRIAATKAIYDVK